MNGQIFFEAESTRIVPFWEFHKDNFILPIELCPKKNNTGNADLLSQFIGAVPSFLGTGTKSFAGFSGSGYLMQNGPTFFREEPGSKGSILRYQIEVEEEGTFRLRLRLKSAGQRSWNDIFVFIPDAKNVSGECPVGSNGRTLHLTNATKISTNDKCNYNWDSNVECDEAKFPNTGGRFVFKLSRGTHNVWLLPRSDYVAVDKVAVYRFSPGSQDIFNDETFTNAPESPHC
jgi:hypothetical protein